jgi:hypothetical protein
MEGRSSCSNVADRAACVDASRHGSYSLLLVTTSSSPSPPPAVVFAGYSLADLSTGVCTGRFIDNYAGAARPVVGAQVCDGQAYLVTDLSVFASSGRNWLWIREVHCTFRAARAFHTTQLKLPLIPCVQDMSTHVKACSLGLSATSQQ